MTKIHSGRLENGATTKFDGMTATASTTDVQEVHLRGLGKSGKRWEARVSVLDEVWRADLDNNGTRDYVLFNVGPYFNGRTTPCFSLTILLMDHDGLPGPFFIPVYKGENGNGIKNLVDLNHNGRAELLISSYDELPSDPHGAPQTSGHWVTQLYKFENFGAEQIRGTIGGITFPYVHAWTYPHERRSWEQQHPQSTEPPIIVDRGTSTLRSVQTKIRKLNRDNPSLEIDPVLGCTRINAEVLVYDRPELRQIAFPTLDSTYSLDLTEQIQRAGLPVQLRGVNKQPGNPTCGVNLLWAAAHGPQ